MKKLMILALLAIMGVAVSGCSGLGGKAVERKVKKKMPGAQTIDEKAAKKVDSVGKKSKSRRD